MSDYEVGWWPGKVLTSEYITCRDNVLVRPPLMAINLRGPRPEKPWRFLNALSRAYRHVRRDVWDARESRLRAKWESYG